MAVTEGGKGLEALLAAHLAGELDDSVLAGQLARDLVEDALSWRVPTIPLGAVRAVMAFTFGNRMLPSGNREPGPVNEALAEIAVGLHRSTGARLWAQWEVAEAIGSRVPPDAIEAIYPRHDSQAEPRYLSTGDVLDEIVARSGRDPATLGPVAIVAVQDHAWRCTAICRRRGIEAGPPEGLPMPDFYDRGSGQPWTRDRLAYLLHDIHCRALDRRDERIEEILSGR
jgi:hypothetical protein